MYVIRRNDAKYYAMRHDGVAQFVRLERARRFNTKRHAELIAKDMRDCTVVPISALPYAALAEKKN